MTITTINIETEEQFDWMVREMRGLNKKSKADAKGGAGEVIGKATRQTNAPSQGLPKDDVQWEER